MSDYQTPLDYNVEANKPASLASDFERVEFIKKTYLHVALAVLGFIIVEFAMLSTPFIVKIGQWFTGGMKWMLLLGGFMFATNYVESWAKRSTDRSQQYMALAAYVMLEAFLFVPLLYLVMANAGGDYAVIKQAGVISLGLFSGLSAVVLLTGKDFSFLKTAITVGGFLALGLIAAGLLFGFSIGIWFSFAMVGLAGASILYQTSNMVHEYNTTQYVAASLGLFASLMLMFWYVLSILSND